MGVEDIIKAVQDAKAPVAPPPGRKPQARVANLIKAFDEGKPPAETTLFNTGKTFDDYVSPQAAPARKPFRFAEAKAQQEGDAVRAAAAEAAKALEKASAERAAAEKIAAEKAAAAKAAAAAAARIPPPPPPGPPPRFLCHEDITKRILTDKAQVVGVYPSKGKLGEGSYGFTTSAEVYFKPSRGGKEFSCVAALKTTKAKDPELASDTLVEISCYARLLEKVGVAKGTYIKLLPSEIKTVMEHYIIDLHQIYTEAGLHRMTMDRRERIVQAFMVQIVSGLSEFHSESLIHRDLKPENVLLAYDGTAKIADYGLSIHAPLGYVRPQTYYGNLTTPTIEPPESVKESGFNNTFDIWSLGCSLYYWLTGEYGFPFWSQYSDWKGHLRSYRIVDSTYEREVRRMLNVVSQKGVSSRCIGLLSRLLSIDLRARPSADEILASSWLSSMTLEKAKDVIIKELEGFLKGRVSSVLGKAKKKGNINVTPNTALETYLRIEPAVSSNTNWSPFKLPANLTSSQYRQGISVSFQAVAGFVAPIIGDFNLPLLNYLHAIELFDRYSKLYRISDPSLLFNSCLFLANKLCEMRGSISMNNYAVKVLSGENYDAVNRTITKVVTGLAGDLFILKGGFVEQFYENTIKSLPSQMTATEKQTIFFKPILSIILYLIRTEIGLEFADCFALASEMADHYTRVSRNQRAFPRSARHDSVIRLFREPASKPLYDVSSLFMPFGALDPVAIRETIGFVPDEVFSAYGPVLAKTKKNVLEAVRFLYSLEH